MVEPELTPFQMVQERVRVHPAESRQAGVGVSSESLDDRVDAAQSEIFLGTPSRLAVDFTDTFNGGYSMQNSDSG